MPVVDWAAFGAAEWYEDTQGSTSRTDSEGVVSCARDGANGRLDDGEI